MLELWGMRSTIWLPSLPGPLCVTLRSKNTTKIFTCIKRSPCSYAYRNPKKHEIGSGTKLFITFLSLRFLNTRRERHNFFLCWLFHLNPFTCGSRRKLVVWSRRAPKINSLVRSLNLNKLLFFKSQNPRPYFRAWRYSRSRSISYLGFLLWHLWLSHPPRTRVNTCAQCVHLTNPCTKQKALSLTKPKGKIYKTKNGNIKKLPPQLYNIWFGVGAPDRVLSMGQIEQNYILLLNWIVWNGIVFDIEIVRIQNWIV